MRHKPLPTLGHDGHQRREGQAQKSTRIPGTERVIFKSRRTQITFQTTKPETHSTEDLHALMDLFIYLGYFDHLKQK